MARDQTIGRGVKPLWVAHHGDRLIVVGAGRRPSYVVDHIQDATVPGCGEEDCQQIVEASRRKSGGDFKGVCSVDVHALVEEAVAAHAISAETGHLAVDLEGRPSVDTWGLHPR